MGNEGKVKATYVHHLCPLCNNGTVGVKQGQLSVENSESQAARLLQGISE